ncbi:MAG: DUF1499 domain-containing protein [Deltaproteobacteria bacterium]|nr:MAG: DUF1499 domain-containing protein [Deltaproteobacteria bacterium]
MLALTVTLIQCSTDPAIKPGPAGRELPPCPDSPNCVSSLSDDKSHYVKPLEYEGSVEKAKEELIAVISSMKRSKIVRAEAGYLHATFTSFLFRFVDDVEFSFDHAQKVIHVRSASRTGYSDLGVNRKRVEEIRKRFATREIGQTD